MIVGFIGLGNLGEKLAATLLRNNINLIVHDKLKKNAVQLTKKVLMGRYPIELAEKVTYYYLSTITYYFCQLWKLDTVLLKAFQKVRSDRNEYNQQTRIIKTIKTCSK